MVCILLTSCSNPVTSEESKEPPRDVTASWDGGSNVRLAWEASEWGGETGYEVWRSARNRSDYVKLATLAKGERFYTDGGVEPARDYYYKVATIYSDEAGKFGHEIFIFTGLWHSDRSLGKILKLDMRDGRVVGSFPVPAVEVTDLAWDGAYLWYADGGNKRVCQFDPITRVVTKVFDAPGYDPHGVARAGAYLWLSSYWEGKIYKVDLRTGSVVNSYGAPGPQPHGMAYDGTYLWVSEWMNWSIYKIDPTNGTVKRQIIVGGAPEGLAWDGTYLWNACSSYNKIFKRDSNGSTISSFPAPGPEADGLEVQR